MDGDKPKKKRFKRYSIGFFHIDIAELRAAAGKLYLFVAIDRTRKFTVAQLVEKADRKTAWEFLGVTAGRDLPKSWSAPLRVDPLIC